MDSKVIFAVLFSFLGGMSVSSGIDEFFARKGHYHWAFQIVVGLAFLFSARVNIFVFVHDGQPLLAAEKCEVGEYDVIVQ